MHIVKLNSNVMRKNSLVPNKGLSLSQATSISNLCNQRATEITSKLIVVNNLSKTVKVNKEDKVIIAAHPLPENVADLLLEKAKLHGCQAFLMENIKAKDAMLKAAKTEHPDISDIEEPAQPRYVGPEVHMLTEVREEWGWEQLSAAELNKYYEAEAFAAHIGQFIHRDGILTGLRNELPNIPDIEWMVIKDGVKSPITIDKHHKAEDLLKLHEELAATHREYEQSVNYFKAKVKNLVTAENARIAKHNADAQNKAEAANNELRSTFDTLYKAYNEKVKSARTEFEKTRQAKIAEIANMRITVDPRFQETVDVFLTKLPDSQE